MEMLVASIREINKTWHMHYEYAKIKPWNASYALMHNDNAWSLLN